MELRFSSRGPSDMLFSVEPLMADMNGLEAPRPLNPDSAVAIDSVAQGATLPQTCMMDVGSDSM